MSAPKKRKASSRPRSTRRYGEHGTITPAGKRTAEEYYADLELVMQMWRKNKSCQAIAEHLSSIRGYTLTRASIHSMIVKELDARKAEAAENFERDCERHVQKLEALIAHCWQQINKLEGSQSNETVQRLITLPDMDGRERKETFVEQIKKDRQGFSDYYGTIRWAMGEIARIKGMYKPLRI